MTRGWTCPVKHLLLQRRRQLDCDDLITKVGELASSQIALRPAGEVQTAVGHLLPTYANVDRDELTTLTMRKGICGELLFHRRILKR